jgi:pyruvate,water dikinase
MKLWKYLESKIRRPLYPDKERVRTEEVFLKRYESFQKILSLNNSVLELMADMEEKLSGEFPINQEMIEITYKDIAEKVMAITDELNELSKDKYMVLYDKFTSINSKIETLIVKRREIPVSALAIPLHEIGKTMADRLGGKSANLGEIKNRLGIPTPDGFAVSAFAFKKFMDYNQLFEKIQRIFGGLDSEKPEVSDDLCKEAQYQIMKAEIPDELETEVVNAYKELCNRTGSKVYVSVRSSALQENGEVSFAGQYATFLNVNPEHILQRYKEVIASLFSPQALFYYKSKGFQESDMIMPVGVFEMIDALAGGVIYTRDPNTPEADNILISVVRGLGKCLVEGIVTPETYRISRDSLEIVAKTIPEQKRMLINRPDEGIEEILLSADIKGRPCMSDEQIKTLSHYAVVIERYYECPQDIEWVLSKNGKLYIVQTRPLTMQLKEVKKHVPSRIEGYPVLIDKGIIACRGIGFGKAYLVRADGDLKNFPEHAVLVAKHTSANYVTVMDRANAIVTDIGAATVHMASLAREFKVPTIVNTEKATEVLSTDQDITVDAVNCIIYKGIVKKLIEYAEAREGPFKGTHGFSVLEKILKWITPLNLISPDDENFKPECCETFHDITRFVHQKAMQEMFEISGEMHENVEIARLYAGIPLQIYLIDLGGGTKGMPKRCLPEHINSLPFKSFLKGITAVEWPEPRHVDFKGFLGMIAHTASIPEAELEQMGEKSYLFISSNYMNFSLRLGYHLSVIEAYMGESINDNYIRFFFKGGGADIERRLRRVELIRRILEMLDFRIKVKEDVIDAMVTKFTLLILEKKLEILGKMTAYTKQLDAILSDEESANFHLQKFVREHMN